jgi:hypothetical protein
MYTLIRSLPLNRLVSEQLPAFAISFVTAEMFYKFHSFTLECGAFLLTWFVFDALIQFGSRLLRAKHTHR